MNHKDESLDHPSLAVEPQLPKVLDGDERWELVTRIASSPHFKKSPRMRQFLLFVAERSLTDHLEDINEYEIGCKVFERGKNYNPSDDSIVRTTARQLRTKVKDYFDAEGLHERWILEIPKGGYVPIFAKREGEAAPAVSNVGELPSAPSGTCGARFWQWIAGAVAAIAIGAVFFAFQLGRRSQDESLEAHPSLVSTILTRSQQPTRVVVGDFGLALTSAAVKRHFSVEDYANRSAVPPVMPQSTDPALRNLLSLLGGGQIVSLPDAIVAAAVLRLGGGERKNVVMQHASQIAARDLRSGNFILLSAPIASPWITLFEDKLNFRYRLTDSSSGVTTEIVNVHPQPGEKSLYSADPSAPGFGLTYGLVARIPNLTGTGKVMLIGGLRYTGFEAAGEYATDPKAAAELARLFKVTDIDQIPDFEVLIETYSINAAPRYVKVAAYRRVGEKL